MSDNRNISCPKCGYEFPIEEVLTKKLEEEYQSKFRKELNDLNSEYQAKQSDLTAKLDEIKMKEENFEQQVKKQTESKVKEIEQKAKLAADKEYIEKIKMLNYENEEQSAKLKKLNTAEAENEKLKRQLKTQADEVETKLRKQLNLELEEALEKERKTTGDSVKIKIQKEYEARMNAVQAENKEQSEIINKMKDTELENAKLKRRLDEKEREVELKYENKLRDDINRKTEEIRLAESERHELKLKDKDEQVKGLVRQIEELQKRAEQGSMQAQGESMELLLEESLKELFPMDQIDEVAKGIKGADVIQTAVNKMGNKCGKIVYESKRTKNFSKEWLQKLKTDTVACGGDVSVLVTQALPEGVDKIALIEGVWVCSYYDYKGLAMALRDGLIKISESNESQKNKGDKINLMYDYLTSTEFKMQLENIFNGFNRLKEDHEKEKAAIQRLWKKREKQYETILDSTNSFLGSIQGIAGSSIPGLDEIDSARNLLDEI